MLLSGCRHSATQHELTIALVSLGPVPIHDVTEAKLAIEKTFNARVVLKQKALPEGAYYAPRKRYRADKILTYLADSTIHTSRIIAITERDISTTYRGENDWGVIGQADDLCAVVSTYRLKGHAAADRLVNSRLRKNVLHELGHTFGLDHCPDKKCVMQDGESGLITTDRADERFCDKCAARLGATLREPTDA